MVADACATEDAENEETALRYLRAVVGVRVCAGLDDAVVAT